MFHMNNNNHGQDLESDSIIHLIQLWLFFLNFVLIDLSTNSFMYLSIENMEHLRQNKYT